jgi:transposase-like protein
MTEISYRRHRFPPVIIQHAVWLYLRFTLSYRDVEELLAERGLEISYETVRCWVLKFGQAADNVFVSAAAGLAAGEFTVYKRAGRPSHPLIQL